MEGPRVATGLDQHREHLEVLGKDEIGHRRIDAHIFLLGAHTSTGRHALKLNITPKIGLVRVTDTIPHHLASRSTRLKGLSLTKLA